MAKIVLVWNTHPNESAVTRHLALELEKNLKSRGHEVKIVKVPFNQTLQGRHRDQPDEKSRHIMKRDEDFIDSLLKKNKDSFFIDLHTSSEEAWYSRPKRFKPSKYRVNEYKLHEETLENMVSPSELRQFKERAWAVELASKYTEGKGVLKKVREKREIDLRAKTYFDGQANLKKTRGANYLSPTSVRKLVHSIDTAVNTQVRALGMGKGYRTPRGKFHKGKRSRKKPREPIDPVFGIPLSKRKPRPK